MNGTDDAGTGKLLRFEVYVTVTGVSFSSHHLGTIDTSGKHCSVARPHGHTMARFRRCEMANKTSRADGQHHLEITSRITNLSTIPTKTPPHPLFPTPYPPLLPLELPNPLNHHLNIRRLPNCPRVPEKFRARTTPLLIAPHRLSKARKAILPIIRTPTRNMCISMMRTRAVMVSLGRRPAAVVAVLDEAFVGRVV